MHKSPKPSRSKALVAGIIIQGKNNQETIIPRDEFYYSQPQRSSGRSRMHSDLFETLDEESRLMDSIPFGLHRVGREAALTLQKVAVFLSLFTILALAILAGIIIAYGTKSIKNSAFTYAVEALLACLASLVIMWRYLGSNTSLHYTRKERQACMLLGALSYIMAVFLTTKTIISLIKIQSTPQSDLVVYVSLSCAVFCFLVAVTKGVVAFKMESVSMSNEAVLLGVVCVLALSAFISIKVQEGSPWIWYIDSCVGGLSALVLIGYGTWTIVYVLKIYQPNNITF